ncbi:MAG: hypothetical protein AB1810_12285 [Pseudomonadota bacterium]
MGEQVNITIDREIYILLQELQVPPNDINAVLRQLMFNAGKTKSRALRETEEDLHHRSLADEIRATEEGVYITSGISP